MLRATVPAKTKKIKIKIKIIKNTVPAKNGYE